MYLLLNDLSIHGQFHDSCSLRCALRQLMRLREVASDFKRDIFTSSAVLNASPLRGKMMQQAVRHALDHNERGALLSWLSKAPFWDEKREHSDGDYLVCRGDIVTGTAVGEAAFRTLRGSVTAVVSIEPSDWTETPLSVILKDGDSAASIQSADINNWWKLDAFKKGLQDSEPPLQSWDDLQKRLRQRTRCLILAKDCFKPLMSKGYSWKQSTAERILELISALDRLVCAVDAEGKRTEEGKRIHEQYFVGASPWFTDSSDSEKHKFRKQLTFKHPHHESREIFCPWHGKVKHLHDPIRIHFNWPVSHGEKVCLVYIGPKITKR